MNRRNAPTAPRSTITTTPPTTSNRWASLLRRLHMVTRRSHQHDVELIRRVHALALEPNRRFRELLELGDARRLLVEQALDDLGTRENQKLLHVELPMLADNFTKDLITHRFRGLHEPAALTAWTRLTEDVLQALAVAFARHLDQAERRDPHDLRLGIVVRQATRERLEHLATMLLLGHVDEVDNNDAAEVAQAQLPRNRDPGFRIGAENRLLQIPVADVAP